MKYLFKILDGEVFWGGSSEDGIFAPFDKKTELTHDFNVECENQTMPLFLSNRGRCIFSPKPFKVKISDGVFEIEGEDVNLEIFGENLREAYRGAQAKYFSPRGNYLPEIFFTTPQYNTWMQHTYNPTEEKVLKYAEEIIENGFKPGILIIDEGWQREYGSWEFDKIKFPTPEKMLKKLHAMGFTVMLWVVPSVRPDGLEFVKKWSNSFNHEHSDDVFFRTEAGKIAISRWWNGYSASFDFSKPYVCEIMKNQLVSLLALGVDGFMFDGGRVEHYTDREAINGPVDKSKTAAERNIAWNEFGTRYRFHEFKDTFMGGGIRSIQRTSDRFHSWNNGGLNTLIPNAIMQGIIGHPFICPDMIGGGSWIHRDLGLPIDEELFVRMAQCSALFPMMQFSWAPWEAVSEEALKLIKEAHDVHVEFAPTILKLVNDAYRTGEPIIRPLCYNYPSGDYERVNDQFMLGDDILVAPVVEKGASIKKVYLPEGKWQARDGKIYEGGKVLSYPVDISSIPYFFKI